MLDAPANTMVDDGGDDSGETEVPEETDIAAGHEDVEGRFQRR